ncbi:MAG TPA: LLM class flavin-dependent oxidoreductase [Chthoniobacterales bacterium]|nr:LLM class flavin-dependent oxidoreductase [Chthoniobacterales bacterium]
MMPFSILDLSPVPEGKTAADALHNSLDLAQHAERWGYRRFWLAEHHNMPGIASVATAVVIGYIAGGTKTIRVGSGGVMLPNHSPLAIAEQFCTLAALYPGRIDLGLGRAPGTDMATARALRRDPVASAESFPRDVQELIGYIEPSADGQRIRPIPGGGSEVPIWLLGSSLFSAQLAAELGLPFAFASHFAPDDLLPALALYRQRFSASSEMKRPYTMVAANVFAADHDREAQRQFTSVQQSFVNLRRGMPSRVPPPIDDIASYASAFELATANHALACSAVGSPESVESALRNFIDTTQPDELMLVGHFYDHRARLRSFEIAAEILSR